MNNVADKKYDFSDTEAFTEQELAELEALSEEGIDFDDEDFDFEDVGFDDVELDGVSNTDASGEALSREGGGDFHENPVAEKKTFRAGKKPKILLERDVSSPPKVDVPPLSKIDFDDEASDSAVFSADQHNEKMTGDEGNAPPPTAEKALPPPAAALPEIPPEMPSVVAAVAAAGSVTDHDEFDETPREGDHVPVPRINIHVFCETTKISHLVEAAAADRRLTKAHVTLLMGGIAKAADHYRGEGTPNLIILETVSGGNALFEGLEKLSEVCDPSTKVIIIGAINDINLYKELMDRGVSEYLIAPKSPVQITRSIASLYVDPSAPPIGRNMVFVGARGGVGSSTICHNVAWAMAEEYNSDTVILDLDLAFGTASLDFEQDPSQGLAEALAAPERLDDVLLDRLLQKCTDRLSLFSAPNMLDRDYNIPASSFEEVLDIVRKGAPNIVIDLPHVWTDWSRNILQTADEIVITATPDLASFRNVKNLLESIKASRVNDSAPYLVLNQMDVPKRPEIPAEQFAEALEIEPTELITWEPNLFGTASTNAEPVFDVNAKAKASQSMLRLARLLLGHNDAAANKRGFDIKSLFKKL